ncbi:adenosine receptor A3-like [Acropora muricata]|uniref:adenosine receptor A3-like n=1 Tax=Acropora muricata TaxID=159855 RepID=UPI0034E49FEC
MTVSQFCKYNLENRERLVYHYSAFMATICALHLFSSLVAILGNTLMIRALSKASSISINLKMLFFSLAFSDLAVGLFAQLMNVFITAAMLKMTAGGDREFDFFCPTILSLYNFFTFSLACASLFTVTAIAVDRLLSVSLHLRYQVFVTERRVAILLALLWVASIAAGFTFISIPRNFRIVTIFAQCVGLLVTSGAYARIYKIVRYHKIQIRCQFQQTISESARRNQLRQQKSAFFVYVVFVICYLPHLVNSITFMILSDNSLSVVVSSQATSLLLFLNSSLNPILYCWRYQEIRHIVKSTLRKILLRSSST